METLVKGIAYHGNRMLTHVREDMQELASSGFNSVLHMFSHNDWDRHNRIMGEIFSVSEYYGLDVWVDNWGLGGPPGDKSHFLSYHPEAHQINSDGSLNPVRVCYNHPSFVDFTKRWIDAVYDAGARKIFWDEPHLADDRTGNSRIFTCRCRVCQRLFEERYNIPMPSLFTKEVEEFRRWTITNYFSIVAQYAKDKGMYNSVCVMFSSNVSKDAVDLGVDLESICSCPALDNIGSDPYWIGSVNSCYEDVYRFVYEKSKLNLDICTKYNKDHNLWLQAFNVDINKEEEIVAAADAIYDAGARTIFAWGFKGSDANDYRAKAPERAWYATKAAFERISERYRNECREAAFKRILTE